MNIGQVLRGFLGDLQPGDKKTLELKVGQIVKGVVLKLLANQEAILNISGIQVKAKLETPLKPDQVTLLQVKPDSTAGQILLKPLQAASSGQGEEWIPEILQNFGLKNTSTHRQLVQLMLQEQIPLTKENVQLLKQASMPDLPHADVEPLQRAAILAFQKQLPVHADTVQALHQVLYGKPLHQLLTQLEEQLTGSLRGLAEQGQVMQQGASTASADLSATAVKPMATELLAHLQSLLKQISELSQSALKQPSSPLASSLADEPTSIAPSQRTETQILADAGKNVKNTPPLPTFETGRAGARPPEAPITDKPTLPQTGREQAKTELKTSPSTTENIPHPSKNVTGAARAANTAATDNKWLNPLLKMMGLDHEKQAVSLLKNEFKLPLQPPIADTPEQVQQQSTDQRMDNLKNVLIQLTSSNDVPPSLQQNMQQLLHHITGQQLLMLPQQASMFAQVHMTIPLYNTAGEQTATVQIHSRKGKRGGLDSQNCRLVFDLKMQSLGDTLIDVQVVDRKVSLQIHNDHPLVAELLDRHRDEITKGLEGIGYHFVSLKAHPLPGVSKAGSSESGTTLSASAVNEKILSKPYRGVDVRI